MRKKIIISIMIITIFASMINLAYGYVWTIQLVRVLWQSGTLSGAVRALPVILKAGSYEVTYTLKGRALWQFLSVLGLTSALSSSDMKQKVQAAIGKTSESWSYNSEAIALESNAVQNPDDYVSDYTFYNYWASWTNGGAYLTALNNANCNETYKTCYSWNLPDGHFYHWGKKAYDTLSSIGAPPGTPLTANPEIGTVSVNFTSQQFFIIPDSFKRSSGNIYTFYFYRWGSSVEESGWTTYTWRYIFFYEPSENMDDDYMVDTDNIATILASNETNGINNTERNTLYTTIASQFQNTWESESDPQRQLPGYNWYGDGTVIDVADDETSAELPEAVRETVNEAAGAKLSGTSAITSTGQQINESESEGTFIGGTYTNQRAGTAYEPEYDDFETLFSAFMTSMKGTSLFSMPSTFTGSIPTSTVCTYDIDCGQFGEHTVNFCSWDTALLILKAIMLLCFSWWAMRIIILKN
jgi:hypothetical protein